MAEKQRLTGLPLSILAAVALALFVTGIAILIVSLGSAEVENEKLSAQVSTLTSEVATLERENTDLESDLSDSQQRGDACLRQSQAYGEAAYNYGSLLVWLLGDSSVGPTPDMSLGTSAMARGNAVMGCN